MASINGLRINILIGGNLLGRPFSVALGNSIDMIFVRIYS